MESFPFFLPNTILTAEQCAEWLARFEVPDLLAEANARYERSVTDAAGRCVPMVVLHALLFDQDAGTAAVVFAIAGSFAQDHNGLDGLAVRFGPNELHEAAADILLAANGEHNEALAKDLAAKEAATAPAADLRRALDGIEGFVALGLMAEALAVYVENLEVLAWYDGAGHPGVEAILAWMTEKARHSGRKALSIAEIFGWDAA